MRIWNPEWYYPGWLNPTRVETLELLALRPDTIRCWTCEAGLVWASGYGHTHHSLRGLVCKETRICQFIDDFIVAGTVDKSWRMKNCKFVGCSYASRLEDLTDQLDESDNEALILAIDYFRGK